MSDQQKANYSVYLSYLILGTSAGYCFFHTNTIEYQFIHLTYYGILTHCTPGIVKWAVEKAGDAPIYWDTLLFETMSSLPWLTADLYLKYNFSWTIAALQGLAPVILLLPEMIRQDSFLEAEKVFNTCIAMNTISLCCLGFAKQNYYAVGAAIIYSFVHFSVKNSEPNYYMTASKQNIYNVGLTAFCFFALEAVLQASEAIKI